MKNLFGNIFSGIPEFSVEERFEDIFNSSPVRIERIVSYGNVSPEGFWYDQDRSEWVILLDGKASILFENIEEPTVLNPGDYIFIPPHAKHRIGHTSNEMPTVWLAVHF